MFFFLPSLFVLFSIISIFYATKKNKIIICFFFSSFVIIEMCVSVREKQGKVRYFFIDIYHNETCHDGIVIFLSFFMLLFFLRRQMADFSTSYVLFLSFFFDSVTIYVLHIIIFVVVDLYVCKISSYISSQKKKQNSSFSLMYSHFSLSSS